MTRCRGCRIVLPADHKVDEHLCHGCREHRADGHPPTWYGDAWCHVDPAMLKRGFRKDMPPRARQMLIEQLRYHAPGQKAVR